MVSEKDERPNTTARKTSEAPDEATRRLEDSRKTPAMQGRTTPTPKESGNGGDSGVLIASSPGRRRERYLIGTRTALGGQPYLPSPQSMDDVVEYLDHQESVEVIRRIKLGGARPFTLGDRSVSEVVVAKIDEGKAQRLRAAAPPHLIIERDSLLSCADYLSMPARIAPMGALLPMRSVATEVVIRVMGERDQPLARASVVIDGGALPAQALTDENGIARVTLFGSSIEAVQALFVRAGANHWDRLIPAPRLTSGTNTVRLRPLSEVHPGFPGERLLGWGQRLMGIDPTGGRFSGRGVRIGLIDSGCDTSHPLLRHVTQGRDFTTAAAEARAGGSEAKASATEARASATDAKASGAETGWANDLLSHGTHCAGIINASSAGTSAQGIVGCAPEAESCMHSR